MQINTNKILMAIDKINFQGTLIDDGWIENLTYDNGKTNLNACIILSEIIYWYRPTRKRQDNKTVLVKKFAGDMLQKSYKDLGERFGISKRQAQDACIYLRKKNLILIDLRNIEYTDKNGTKRKANNLTYIAPVMENISKITGADRVIEEIIIEEPSENIGITIDKDPITLGCDTPITLGCDTNTETTCTQTFIYNNNKEKKDVVVEIENLKNYMKEQLKENLSSDDMITLIKEAEKVNKNIEYIKEKCEIAEKSSYTNLIGFLVTAIKKDYKLPVQGEPNKKNEFNNFEQHGIKYTNEELEAMIRWKR